MKGKGVGVGVDLHRKKTWKRKSRYRGMFCAFVCVMKRSESRSKRATASSASISLVYSNASSSVNE